MRIANPIYDTVFKYLLEDNSLAKLIISTIIGEEITELDFCPQEQSTTIAGRNLTVYRMDFAATIKNTQGESRKVLIELQKAKLDTDIMRFRRYIGDQYKDPSNAETIPFEYGDGILTKKALPLLTIYFLGHSLEQLHAPAIHVRRDCIDLASGEKFEKKDPFIESLTHDSYVIQIPHLHSHRRTEVEQLLQIFSQERTIEGDKHILEIDEEEVPEHYRPIIRRLQRAIADSKILRDMDVEDDILEELQKLERIAELAQEKMHRTQMEMKRVQEEMERERAEKERAQEDMERERAEKERERKEKERFLAMLKRAGIEVDESGSES
jgi:hypothetical protein